MPVGTQIMILNYAEVPSVGARGNLENVLRVTIKVGDYGPFTQDFPKGTSAEVVNQWKAQKQAEVQAVCGCS